MFKLCKMKFHNVHGKAISLSDDRTQASRSESNFCNGLVFSEQPIKVGQKLCVELTCITSWSGALRIGITTNDPSRLLPEDLPKYAFPDLTKKEGYWARAVNETVTSTGAKITFYIATQGQLQVFVNNEHKGAYLTQLPTNRTLWLFLDIYGNTKAAKFVRPDDAPKEILARGPDAVEAYEKACASGTQPVFRTRLMLVGKDRVGKTSLKRALTGQRHNESEETTDGIDLSASCSFNMSNQSSWRLAIKGDLTEDEDSEYDRKSMGILGGVDGLEEEYHRALATNIVQELLYQKRQKESATKMAKDQRSAATTPSSARNAKDRRKPLIKQTTSGLNVFEGIKEIPPDLVKEVPDRVVHLVQDMLNQSTKKPGSSGASESLLSSTSQPSERNPNVILNIWDFAGQVVYYTTHQVFLTSRAVYVIVFNLCDDLSGKHAETPEKDTNEEELSTLDYMDFWMRSIHAHAAENTRNSVDNTTLSPPIFIVGTHRNSLNSDVDKQNDLVEDKFCQLRDYLTGKPYTQHIVTPFFAVENNTTIGEDEQIDNLRKEIEKVASRESYMGERMPIKWLKFEQEVTEKADSGTNFATYDQIQEIATNHSIHTPDEVKTLLEFYHDLGIIIYYGHSQSSFNILQNTVILHPQWLIDMFQRIIMAGSVDIKWDLFGDKRKHLEMCGILEEPLIDVLWHDVLDQKLILLGLMEKFDLICKRLPPQGQSHREENRSFYVPMRLSRCEDKAKLYTTCDRDAVFYLDFNGFLPDGLFYRILTRAARWSQCNGGRNPYMYRRVARFYLDADHDFVLDMGPRCYHRIKVVVMRVGDSDDIISPGLVPIQNRESPDPAACAKVRNFLESTLFDVRVMWMKRIAYKMCLRCVCGKECQKHYQSGCTEEACIHFIDLDECLANKVVCCEHRRVKTCNFQKLFPQPKSEFQDPILPLISLKNAGGNIEKNVPDLPSWMKGAAKLLNGGTENQDWIALAKLMGYKQLKIDKINNDLNPALALLTDWILSSGNTTLSVDLMTLYLEQLNRDDIMEVIQKARETDLEPPQVFISYQWDGQDEVQALRDRLEKGGFTCWMDIGQMGGGDQLNAKIDDGIRNCKAVIACVTPKYVVSHHCNRELGLADILHKPIIPVMFDTVMWPPPGGMAVIFSQLVYINMKGIGGHGGTGIHADLEDKYNEIIQHLALYATPLISPCIDSSVTVTVNQQPNLRSASLCGTSISSLIEPDFPVMPNLATVPTSDSRIPASQQPATGMGNQGNTVEQVHVAKCAVCIVL